MLALGRRENESFSLFVRDPADAGKTLRIRVRVVITHRDICRIAIDAPECVAIVRDELLDTRGPSQMGHPQIRAIRDRCRLHALGTVQESAT